MQHLDANAMIGPHMNPREGRFFDARDLLAEMDFFGIDEALVYHGMAREYDGETGNRELLDALQGHPRLHPCWVMGLHHVGRQRAPAEVLAEAVSLGVKAARMFFGDPLSDSAFLDPCAYREILTELERHRMPTLLDFSREFRIDGLDEVLERFPALPLILCRPPLGVELKLLYPRMRDGPNLLLEISGIHGNGVVEDIVRQFGPERLVFGTHYPWFSPGQAKISLAYAALSRDEREAIACRNMQRLMREVRP